ncbi:MAG: hypothetical protein JW754_05755 [Candidatus Aenigmarchaeota archaeon]|nr:hypothetical protein [Candidatus Aenigmarchaeota archaeon]
MIPRKYKYVTNRAARNKAGEEAGSIRVLVKTGSDMAETDYTCPECTHSEHVEKEWKRPFSVKCSKCGYTMRLPKLKDELKRDKKREKK